MLKQDKRSYKYIGIYNIGYITINKIGDCKKIYSLNPLYLGITHASRYIAEINENKYLIFDSMDENKELNKPLKFHYMSITIRSVFKEDGKLYPQVLLDDTLYELII